MPSSKPWPRSWSGFNLFQINVLHQPYLSWQRVSLMTYYVLRLCPKGGFEVLISLRYLRFSLFWKFWFTSALSQISVSALTKTKTLVLDFSTGTHKSVLTKIHIGQWRTRITASRHLKSLTLHRFSFNVNQLIHGTPTSDISQFILYCYFQLQLKV